jgi:endonuclease/exonuclease/phosphatase family metal-dependent hydrolase
VWWLLVLPGFVWAAFRLGGWEFGPLVQLFAFTPYVAAWSLFPLVGAALRKRWITAGVGAVTTVALGVAVIPRAVTDTDRSEASGVQLRVLTANMLWGGSDPANLVRIVRDGRVDVLALQEYTPAAEAGLRAAGLLQLLPAQVTAPVPDTTGSALYSRYPLSATGIRHNTGGFLQAYGTIAVAGGPPVLVESAHPLAPWSMTSDILGTWRHDLETEPHATPDGPLRILLGDFNSTLDHAPLRALIRSGYTDAADAVGKGWTGTWGPYDGVPIPPVTIDHVLVDERIRVDAVSVHTQPKSDHRAVLATLTLPKS